MGSISFAQELSISGVVRDASGEGLPGVTVLVKGTTQGTSTSIEGDYQILVADESATLVFSYIGFQAHEIAVTALREANPDAESISYDVTMQEEALELETVVVTGYQKIDKDLFTGSTSELEVKEVKIDGVEEVGRILEGRVAGVSVQIVSGTFGAAPKVRIRGSSSIYGAQDPLWVVDGVVLEDVVSVSQDDLSSGDPRTVISSAVANLNPDDIESFQILKDASATALYGARAMNGVIVIKTKSGKSGKPSVAYNAEVSMLAKPSYSQYNIMNSQEQMGVYLEMYEKGLLNPAAVINSPSGGVFLRMYQLLNTINPATGKAYIANTNEGWTQFLSRYEYANTDWFDVLFRNSVTNKHSLSFTAGSENASYYTSIALYDDQGWSISDKVSRATASLKANYYLGKKLNIGLSTNASWRSQKVPGTLDRRVNTVDGTYERDFDVNPFSYAINTSRTIAPYDENGDLEYVRLNYAPFNILSEAENNFIQIGVRDFQVQSNINYSLLDQLEYSFTGAIRYADSNQDHQIREGANMPQAFRANQTTLISDNNQYLYRDPDDPAGLPRVVLPQGGFRNQTQDKLSNYYFRNVVNWNELFANDYSVSVLLGQELRYINRDYSQFDGIGYQYARAGQPFVDYNFVKRATQGGFNYYSVQGSYERYLAFFTTTAFAFREKYVLNLTARYDGSNLLGKSRTARWLPTWSLSGGWNAYKEGFMQSVPAISNLVFRLTYGLTASTGAASNSTLLLGTEVTPRLFLEDREPGVFISDLENAQLTWEKQYETNIGFDLGLMNNRIDLKVDAYLRNAFDLIGPIETSGIGGQVRKWANYADMETQGLECVLGTSNIARPAFQWNSQFVFSYSQNTITNMSVQPNIIQLLIAEGGPQQGYPDRGLYSFVYKGLSARGIPKVVNHRGKITGEKDVNGVLTSVSDINFQDNEVGYLQYEGPVTPPVTGGLRNSFDYKGLSLAVFLSYQLGNKIRLKPDFSAFYSDSYAHSRNHLDRWIDAGDEQHTNVPVIASQRLLYEEWNLQYAYTAYNWSTDRVVDGSFVRLKEASMGYNLTSLASAKWGALRQVGRWIQKIGIQSANVRFAASNIWLLYADKRLEGQDPEFFNAGGVALPVPRRYTVALNLVY